MGPMEAVLKYLQTQNRPYSANDITQNLHKEFGKTAIQKALDELAKDEKIREKVYGKQKIYSALQNDDNSNDAAKMSEELSQLDVKINEASDRLKNSEKEVKSCETKLKDLLNLPKTEEAATETKELEETIKSLKQKLSGLTSSTLRISQKDKDSICKENEKAMKEYRKRKRMCMDIVDSILESYPKSKKSLIEEMGIETDEEVGCCLSKP